MNIYLKEYEFENPYPEKTVVSVSIPYRNVTIKDGVLTPMAVTGGGGTYAYDVRWLGMTLLQTSNEYKNVISDKFQALEGVKEEDAKAALEKVDEITAFLRNPEWIYGKHAPASCTLESRYSWGGICVELDVKNGTITACSAYTDSLDWRLAQIIEGALIGCQFSKPAILSSLDGKVADHILADLSNLFEI